MNGLTTEVRQLFQKAMKLDMAPSTTSTTTDATQTLRALETASNICPYLKSLDSADMAEL
jgi:hypothetical protein